jgi:hypothetical protein
VFLSWRAISVLLWEEVNLSEAIGPGIPRLSQGSVSSLKLKLPWMESPEKSGLTTETRALKTLWKPQMSNVEKA